jgi:hypothetical protein
MVEGCASYCLSSRLSYSGPSTCRVLVQLTRDKVRTSLPSPNGVKSLKDSGLLLIPDLNLGTLYPVKISNTLDQYAFGHVPYPGTQATSVHPVPASVLSRDT